MWKMLVELIFGIYFRNIIRKLMVYFFVRVYIEFSCVWMGKMDKLCLLLRRMVKEKFFIFMSYLDNNL